MIHLFRGDLAAAATESILRPCSASADPVTAASRRVEAGAGEAVTRRLQGQGELPVGTAILTPAGELACDFLVHVVVQSRDEEVTLGTVQRGLVNALRRASDFGIESMSLPLLGTGAGNLDAEEAAKVMAEVIRNHMAEGRPPRSFFLVVESEYEESVLAAALSAVGLTTESASG